MTTPLTTAAPATNASMEMLVTRLHALPLTSPVVGLLTELLTDPNITVDEIARVVALDPSIAMRLIRTVNSAYFGLPEPLTDLVRAIQFLGFNAVQEIVKYASLLRLFNMRVPNQAAVNARIEGLWQHAVATGAAARILARRLHVSDDLPYMTVGLLHDVGKVALLLLQPQRYEEALYLARSERIPLVVAERRILPFDHTQFGRVICEGFGQPEAIAFAVGRHHSVRSGARYEACSELAAVAHVADILARALGAGWWGDQVMPRLDLAARATLNLEADDARQLLDALEEEYPRISATMRAIFPIHMVSLHAPK